MDELKRQVKLLIPEEKHLEIDKIFREWIAGLKVHTILEKEPQGGGSREDQGSEDRESKSSEEGDLLLDRIPLKCQIEQLKKQIESFKQKMRLYRASSTSSTDLALGEVKEEIGRVREGIMKMRVNVARLDESERGAENAELLEKLDEVKQFLERLR